MGRYVPKSNQPPSGCHVSDFIFSNSFSSKARRGDSRKLIFKLKAVPLTMTTLETSQRFLSVWGHRRAAD